MQYNIYIVGVGGQGAISLGQIITKYALEKGERVKFYREVGMAQRGGPVHCEVRIGEIFGSRIPPLSSDITVVMELVEGLKTLEYIKPGGMVILNKKMVYPIDIMTNPEKYPPEDEIIKLLEEAKAKIIWVDSARIASEVGLPVAENIVLLGVLSFIFSFDKELIIKTLKDNTLREIEKNIAAFSEGYKVAEGMEVLV